MLKVFSPSHFACDIVTFAHGLSRFGRTFVKTRFERGRPKWLRNIWMTPRTKSWDIPNSVRWINPDMNTNFEKRTFVHRYCYLLPTGVELWQEGVPRFHRCSMSVLLTVLVCKPCFREFTSSSIFVQLWQRLQGALMLSKSNYFQFKIHFLHFLRRAIFQKQKGSGGLFPFLSP